MGREMAEIPFQTANAVAARLPSLPSYRPNLGILTGFRQLIDARLLSSGTRKGFGRSEEVRGHLASVGAVEGSRLRYSRWWTTITALLLSTILYVATRYPELSHLALQSGSFQA